MLPLFVVLFVTDQVAGQSQCPQVSASFKDDLDISSFAVSANRQSEDFKDDGNASDVDDDQCKLQRHLYIYLVMYTQPEPELHFF